MKTIGKHVNIINLLGACTQDGEQLEVSSVVFLYFEHVSVSSCRSRLLSTGLQE